jgi:hypothetical protein
MIGGDKTRRSQQVFLRHIKLPGFDGGLGPRSKSSRRFLLRAEGLHFDKFTKLDHTDIDPRRLDSEPRNFPTTHQI